MLKYPISTILWLSKITIKDKIQDALKLHNNIDVKLTAIVKDKDEKIIKVHKQRSHSFVANFLNALAQYFATPYGTSYPSYFRMNNTSNSSFYLSSYIWGNAAEGDSSHGIVIGTGTSPPAPQDYQLEKQITNGSSSGQMQYGAHSFNPSSGSVSISNNTSSFQIIRTFINNSGSSITVSEVGYIVEVIDINGYVDYVLLIHDLLSSPITVPNGSTLNIVYTISVTT